MKRRSASLLLCLFVASLVTIPGCGEVTDGYVHVDNGSEELMVVFVDGRQKARIGPGRSRELKLPIGEHNFVVKQNDEVIYEQSHNIDPGERAYRSPRYVLNPDGNNRYCRVTVLYEDDTSSGQDLADLISMISNTTDSDDENEPGSEVVEQEESVEPEKSEKEKRAEARRIARQYWTIKKRLLPISNDAFFQVEDLGNLFKPLPTVVYSQTSGDQKRETLARVPVVLHEYLSEAGKVKSPTAEQLERLQVAEDVTISYIPFR